MRQVDDDAREDHLALANRGTKRHCGSCGAPFYDMNRDPIVCPKCHSPYVAVQRLPARISRARMNDVVVPLPVETAPFEEEEILDLTKEDEDEEDGEDMPADPDDESGEDDLRE